MKEVVSWLTSKEVKRVVKKIQPYFKNVPHLPKGLVEFIVKIAPWAVGISGVLAVFSGLSLLSTGVGYSNNYWAELAGLSSTYFWVMGLFSLVMGAISLMAFKPVRAKKLNGWLLMFVNSLVGATQGVVAMFFTYYGTSSLIGTAIGLLIGLYVLFEIKSHYK